MECKPIISKLIITTRKILDEIFGLPDIRFLLLLVSSLDSLVWNDRKKIDCKCNKLLAFSLQVQTRTMKFKPNIIKNRKNHMSQPY